jgi:hypothetical protein
VKDNTKPLPSQNGPTSIAPAVIATATPPISAIATTSDSPTAAATPDSPSATYSVSATSSTTPTAAASGSHIAALDDDIITLSAAASDGVSSCSPPPCLPGIASAPSPLRVSPDDACLELAHIDPAGPTTHLHIVAISDGPISPAAACLRPRALEHDLRVDSANQQLAAIPECAWGATRASASTASDARRLEQCVPQSLLRALDATDGSKGASPSLEACVGKTLGLLNGHDAGRPAAAQPVPPAAACVQFAVRAIPEALAQLCPADACQGLMRLLNKDGVVNAAVLSSKLEYLNEGKSRVCSEVVEGAGSDGQLRHIKVACKEVMFAVWDETAQRFLLPATAVDELVAHSRLQGVGQTSPLLGWCIEDCPDFQCICVKLYTPWLGGGSLADHIHWRRVCGKHPGLAAVAEAAGRWLAVPQLLRAVGAVAGVLDTVQRERRYLLLDVKPENLVFDEWGSLQIIDPEGMVQLQPKNAGSAGAGGEADAAAAAEDALDDHPTTSARVYDDDGFMYTVFYAAPELVADMLPQLSQWDMHSEQDEFRRNAIVDYTLRWQLLSPAQQQQLYDPRPSSAGGMAPFATRRTAVYAIGGVLQQLAEALDTSLPDNSTVLGELQCLAALCRKTLPWQRPPLRVVQQLLFKMASVGELAALNASSGA